jgi:hypothetical protein
MAEQTSNNMKPYFIEFGGSMGLYVVVLIGVVATRSEGGWGVLELLPTLPLLLGIWAIIRQYRRMDEFFQRIHSEAFALGALILGLLAIIWGFGENAGWPAIPMIWVGPALVGLWGLCLPIVSRRYK